MGGPPSVISRFLSSRSASRRAPRLASASRCAGLQPPWSGDGPGGAPGTARARSAARKAITTIQLRVLIGAERTARVKAQIVLVAFCWEILGISCPTAAIVYILLWS